MAYVIRILSAMLFGTGGTKTDSFKASYEKTKSVESDNLSVHGIEDFDCQTNAPQSNRCTVGTRKVFLFHMLTLGFVRSFNKTYEGFLSQVSL